MNTMRNCAIFASGMSMGIALTLFLSPQSGPEVRNGIRSKLRQGAQAIRDKKHEAEAAIERETRGVEAALDAGKRAYYVATQRDLRGNV